MEVESYHMLLTSVSTIFHVGVKLGANWYLLIRFTKITTLFVCAMSKGNMWPTLLHGRCVMMAWQ